MPMGLFSDGAKDGVKVRAIGASAVGVHGIFVGETEASSVFASGVKVFKEAFFLF